MKTTTKKSFTSKKGITINEGERVSVSFDVKRKSTGEPFAQYIRLTTEDGRRFVTSKLKGAGIRVPSMKQLERWVCDSVCDSVFGSQVEPDGWDSEGSPSLLLAFCLV